MPAVSLPGDGCQRSRRAAGIKALLPGYRLSVLAMLLAAASAQAQALQSLDELVWSQRILLLFSDHADVQLLHDTLDQHKSGLDERHMAWFIISEDGLRTNFSGDISREFHTRLQQRWMRSAHDWPQVILIGKDGGAKLRSRTLDLGQVFDLIDSMPMRQFEMKKRGG